MIIQVFLLVVSPATTPMPTKNERVSQKILRSCVNRALWHANISSLRLLFSSLTCHPPSFASLIAELGLPLAPSLPSSSLYSRTFDAPIFHPSPSSSPLLTVHPKTSLPPNYARTPYYSRSRITLNKTSAALGLPGINITLLHPSTFTILSCRAFDLMWRNAPKPEDEGENGRNLKDCGNDGVKADGG